MKTKFQSASVNNKQDRQHWKMLQAIASMSKLPTKPALKAALELTYMFLLKRKEENDQGPTTGVPEEVSQETETTVERQEP